MQVVNVIERERMSVGEFFAATQAELAARVAQSKKTRLVQRWILRDEVEQHLTEIDREWLRNLPYQHPLYGADSSGSLFHAESSWNMAALDSILRLLPSEIDGVTRPYLYFGSFRSMFAWHVCHLHSHVSRSRESDGRTATD